MISERVFSGFFFFSSRLSALLLRTTVFWITNEWGSRSGGKTLFCHVKGVTKNVSVMTNWTWRSRDVNC